MCPVCGCKLDSDEDSLEAFKERHGKGRQLECAEGHVSSLHQCALAARVQPSYFDIFYPLGGIESGSAEVQVGEWRSITLSKEFVRLDHVSAHWTSEQELEPDFAQSVRVDALHEPAIADTFWVLTSSSDPRFLNHSVTAHWTAFGDIAREERALWRELLILAARQLLSHNYRSAVLQSAVAIETFVYEFVRANLTGEGIPPEQRWSNSVVNEYFLGQTMDSLPIRGTFRVCVEGIMRIPITNSEEWSNWCALKTMRDGLAHGDLLKYRNVPSPGGQPFRDDEARARFAYSSAVKMIYFLRYFEAPD